VTSLAQIEGVIGLDDDPVRRNSLITQSYHDLSLALADVLGRENANWCTFATWASRTAGRFIGEAEVPRAFRELLGRFEPVHVTLGRVNDALKRVDEDAFEEDSVLEVVHDVVQDIARLVAAGNLAVFGELGPAFAKAVDALTDEAALTALLESLTPEQGLLHSAFQHYAAARVEADPRRKAALMLLANGQVGLHEQIRLQPFIAGSIDAPVGDAVAEALECTGPARALVARLVHPVADCVERLWEEFSTRELMTLSLPDGDLLLGRDLPHPRGAPLYPAVLDPVDDPEAVELLAQYGADAPTSAAVDWARLSNRMRYILDLFRSRQCDAALFDEPLS
jgi:hypothetical protein